MKKVIILLVLFLMGFTLAESACDLNVTLLNQDPYPAIPGDYVELVFQIDGLSSPDCDDITFNLLPSYPMEFDPGESGFRSFKKVNYVKDYKSSILVPYEIRMNKDALDGTNPIEVEIQNEGDAAFLKTFNIEIEDARVEFEVHISNYNYATKELTIEILNIGSSDIEALTIEIPKQNGISVKGSNRIIVGDLDSNEYTSADFEATLTDGEIKLNLIYSDSINNRRTVEEVTSFDSSYFTERVSDEDKKIGIRTYLILGVIALIVIYIIYKKIKKAKAKKKRE